MTKRKVNKQLQESCEQKESKEEEEFKALGAR